ncbi:carboxymuconolactone decarboxylase family protein [Mycobacteroides chelonae]|uniref:carboxymuconolactone decarboxylase family protein n=1 Tax=Mycobacteroides chelonae TaxID=1774 RepID=UPI0008A8FD17|nr:carboxymuconolactone decarboxylase family protein [Mycobacteroides chelonae]OHU66026.1 carboxymuconolactone decarboxylase [Mycobacteroides chelonae]
MSVVLPTVADLSPAQREAFELFPANLTRGLVMTKNSAKPYLTLGLSFRDGGLSPETRELVILRVGAVTRTQYEIHHHTPEARRVGVPTGVIDAVVSGADSFGDERLAALIGFVDELLAGIAGPPANTDAVQKFYSDNEIAEIVLLTGHYVMTALFLKTLGITADGEDATQDILTTATNTLRSEEGQN